MPSAAPARTLLLGATGFLGSHLARRLVEAGLRLRIFRRPGSSLNGLIGLEFDDLSGDLRDKAALAQAAEGQDLVFNLAACTSLLSRDREERERLNAEFPARLAETLLTTRWKGRLVHCSTAAAVGVAHTPAVLDEGSPFDASDIHYCDTKRRGEQSVLAAARSGLDAVVVNPATILSDRLLRASQREAFDKAASGRLGAYPCGGSSFCWADDVAEGMRLAALKGRRGERYILAGENMTFRDYFRSVASLAGVPPPLFALPAWALPPLGALGEALAGKLGADTGRFAARFGWYSSEKARNELGYTHRPLELIIRAMLGTPAGR